MTSNELTTLGQRVGQAMARDVIAEADLSRVWTGLDPQDGDLFMDAGLVHGSPEWSEAETAAEIAFVEAIHDAGD